MAATRHRKLIGRRRRVEDEADEEFTPDALDADDESLTEGSLISDDQDGADDSDTSHVDGTSPASLQHKSSPNGRIKPSPMKKTGVVREMVQNPMAADTEAMLKGLNKMERKEETIDSSLNEDPTPSVATEPTIVSSASAGQGPNLGTNRRQQEHEDYKRRRDEDPAFVPNRGAFFMHDHRHAGPAANGFRPFGRGRGRGGRVGPFQPVMHTRHIDDPTTSSPWTHDMHDTIAHPFASRQSRPTTHRESLANGNGYIPTLDSGPEPINRTLSTEKHIGNVNVRILIPGMEKAHMLSAMAVKQYTKLPDHRPPLRRDKPVRISLPTHAPRYIFPAPDRSFIFIPRAMRPNQQRMRGKSRSGMGSMGGFSRKTSVFGGSYYGGSVYSPSVALSRRSSVHERDYLFSPTGSVMSRQGPAMDSNKPTVKLPPAPARMEMPNAGSFNAPAVSQMLPGVTHSAASSQPTLYQPRPQKNISVADLDSTSQLHPPGNQPFHSAFHQQVPPTYSNGLNHDVHQRQQSFSQLSAGTPLSQIPERAIHAAPFQPNNYNQQPYYAPQQYQGPPQHGYFYGSAYPQPVMPSVANPHYEGPQMPLGVPGPGSSPVPDNSGSSINPTLVAQPMNGMVYYYDATQFGPSNNYQSYTPSQGYQSGPMGMENMGAASGDPYYYPQHAPNMVYYPQ